MSNKEATNVIDGAGKFAGINRLEAMQEWKFENPELAREGKKIILPADPGEMPIDDAIGHLQRVRDQENMPANPVEFIECIPYDGLVAFRRAIDHLFGFSAAEVVMTMFGPEPPKPMTIMTGPGDDDSLVVLTGEFSIPAMPKEHRIGITIFRDEEQNIWGVNIYARTTRKYENVVREVAKYTRRFLKMHSIYRGKAFRLFTSDDSLNLGRQPEFLNTSTVEMKDLHLNDDEMSAVTTSVFNPIMHTDKLRKFGVPLKRGVLLEGPFGVGKSLISAITAKLCEMHGWTFITIEETTPLREALLVARQYQPCVVFAEDLDREVAIERDDQANSILNTIDGVLSKNIEVMVVFTTNNVDQIAKAMLRPGRLDSVISIGRPNEITIERLLRYYAKGSIADEVVLKDVSAELVGQIPATIREVVERSKLVALPKATATQTALGTLPLSADDLFSAARSMVKHLALLNEEVKEDTLEEALQTVAKAMFQGGLASGDNWSETIEAKVDATRSVTNASYKKIDRMEKVIEKVGEAISQ